MFFKSIFLLLCLTMSVLQALEVVDSFTVKNRQLLVRFDGAKFDNINRIEFNGRAVGLDDPGAHYGTVVFFAGDKGFIGSGHKETGAVEQLLSMTLEIDGKEQEIVNDRIYECEKMIFTKQFLLKDIHCTSVVTLSDNMLEEVVTLRAASDQKIQYLYLFMHPWSINFDKLFVVNQHGKKSEYSFASDDKFPQRDKLKAAAFYSSANGDLIISRTLEEKSPPLRFIWDRKAYRKDYLVTFFNETIKKESTATFKMKTFFFEKIPTESWQDFVMGTISGGADFK